MVSSPCSNTLYFVPTPAKNSADGGLPLELLFFLVVIPAVVHLIASTLKTPDIQCACVFSSHSFWTSMDVPAGVTQEEGNTGFSIHLLSAVLALIFLARRIQPFLSLVDREVELCVLTI